MQLLLSQAPISLLILLLNCCFLFSSFSSCCLRHQCLLLPSAEVAVMIFALPTQHTGTFAAVCYAESIKESRKYDITLCYVKCKLRILTSYFTVVTPSYPPLKANSNLAFLPCFFSILSTDSKTWGS